MVDIGKAWVISVDMGYGHQRAAYPLKDIAYKRILTANNDQIISEKERKMWNRSRNFYELISRVKEMPILGKILFYFFDKFLSISPLFPFRDLSKASIATLYFKRQILKKGLCDSLIEYIRKKDIPIITTHFIPALACSYHGLKNIFCVVTDTDINRVWVIDKPEDSKIKYLVPCEHVVHRLREYGIKDKDIILTGFPLPKENIGGLSCSIIKKDLGLRLANLDPNKIYISKYKGHLRRNLGRNFKNNSSRPLTLTYMVGGAGAEKDIGLKMIKSLKDKIVKKKVIVNLVAGTRLDVKSHFEDKVKKMGLIRCLGSTINIIFALNKKDYFSYLNEKLHTTDIIWSKPSEVSFYTALGLPIIIAPPVGAHENFNKEWLEHIGSGFVQKDPSFTDDWLFYWLENGRLAEAAWEGFAEARSVGIYNIEKALFARKR